VLEIGDNDGSTVTASGSISEPSHETTRQDLVWSTILLEDQTALLGELVSLCQQAVYRYCNEHDLFRIGYSGYSVFDRPGVDGFKSIPGIIPTTFSLVHWVNKLNFIICKNLQKHAQQAPGLADFIPEVLTHATELCEAAESGDQLDRSQISFQWLDIPLSSSHHPERY
jgi:hypothetical protein